MAGNETSNLVVGGNDFCLLLGETSDSTKSRLRFHVLFGKLVQASSRYRVVTLWGSYIWSKTRSVRGCSAAPVEPCFGAVRVVVFSALLCQPRPREKNTILWRFPTISRQGATFILLCPAPSWGIHAVVLGTSGVLLDGCVRLRLLGDALISLHASVLPPLTSGGECHR